MTDALTQPVSQPLSDSMNSDRESGSDLGEQPDSQHRQRLQRSFVRGKPDGQRAGAGGG